MTYNKRLQVYFGHLSLLIASDSHEVIIIVGNFINTDYLEKTRLPLFLFFFQDIFNLLKYNFVHSLINTSYWL